MRGRLGSRRGLGKELNRPQPFLGVPGLDVRVLAEPQLLFGDLQKIVDPRVGLGLYGPFDIDDPGRRTAIRLGPNRHVRVGRTGSPACSEIPQFNSAGA